MNLSLTPENIQTQPYKYLFTEKMGPFHETAMPAWQEAHQKILASQLPTQGAMALIKLSPGPTYRAGFMVATQPEKIPEGLQYLELPSSFYAQFVLKGPYSQLGEAWGKVMEQVGTLELEIRDDFFIEYYANNPETTAEENLETHILIPIVKEYQSKKNT